MQWLLKYPLDWYASGHLELAWTWPTFALAVLLLSLGLFWLPGYRRVQRARAPFLLRTALVALLLLALLQPTLVVDAPVPVRGHVALLLDDSLSMRIAAPGRQSGAQQVAALFGAGAPLAAALDDRFDTRYYRFGDGVQPHAPGVPLAHADARSDLGPALARVADGHDAASLAAVVVVSDGGGTTDAAPGAPLERALLALRARSVPVHVLEIGAGDAAPDLELAALRLPRHALRGDRLDVEVELVQHGYAGQRVTLILDDDGLILDRHALELPADGRRLRVTRRLAFGEAGERSIGARITPLPGELTEENNRLARSLEVRGEPLRVLHFEGEPRFEVKFLRRALAQDPGLRLASLVRTADNKYYRLGIEEPTDLADGFPASEELFGYDVLVLGSVPAELLSADQRASVVDFVARRGGGLLLLGGRQAFAEGGYARAPFADLLPVLLDVPQPGFRAEVALLATDAGRRDARLDFGDAEPLAERLARLPPLAVVNPVRRAKPGATVLLEGADGRGAQLVLLAAQRYGRGQVASFAVRNSWRWQMHAQVPLDDQTHETLWRQLLRDLGRAAGGRVRLALATAQATPGEAVEVVAEALDARYLSLAEAELVLEVTTPLGVIERYPMQRAPGAEGGYRARFAPALPGRHGLAVRLLEDGTPAAAARDFIDVSATGAEYAAHGRDAQRLARIAAATGGQRLDITRADHLPGLVDDATGTRTELKRLALWDAPLLLLALLLLASAEWALRRARRLA